MIRVLNEVIARIERQIQITQDWNGVDAATDVEPEDPGMANVEDIRIANRLAWRSLEQLRELVAKLAGDAAPRPLGVLEVAYTDAHQAMTTLGATLDAYVPGATGRLKRMGWSPFEDGGVFSWGDRGGTLSKLGIAHGRWPMTCEEVPLDAPHAATAEAYKAWMAEETPKAKERAARESEAQMHAMLAQFYGPKALEVLDALRREGAP